MKRSWVRDGSKLSGGRGSYGIVIEGVEPSDDEERDRGGEQEG